MPVTRDHRYTRDRPCPICGGYDRAPRGKGIRCFGYLSNDGGWAHCTREEHAGDIQPSGKSGAYPHRLAGSCTCGRQHGARTVMGGSAYQTTATYDYRDPEGDLLFQVLRKVHPRTGEKAFLQRRPDPSSATGWTWNLHGVERVLYHLPELQKADPEQPVFLVEGEKDVDRLLQEGLAATTNPGGAGKWAKHYVRWLKGRHVVVIPDNDDSSTRPPYAGQLHANEVARSLVGVAATVRLLELPGVPPKGDVSDWLDQGGTPERLLELAAMTPEYLPAPGESDAATSSNGHATVEDLEHTRPVWEGNKWRLVSQRIITEGLLGHGTFITAEEAPFYFDRSTRVLCDLEGFDMKLLLNERYQINAREALYSYLLEDMTVEARARGTRAHVRQFAHYDSRANALYLDLGRGRMLRMDGREIQEVDNGADGVLFAAPPDTEPLSYLPDAPRGVFGKTLVRSLKFAEGEALPHTVEEQQVLLLAWLLSVAFESIQPTKPLALARGPEGAGKSSLFRHAGRIFYGPTFEVDSLGKESEQGFWVTVTNRRFVAWDNVDQRVPWLEDAPLQSRVKLSISAPFEWPAVGISH